MKRSTNKRKKGLDFQDWIKKFLEEKGWTVHNQRPVGKLVGKNYISQRNDIFGCVDLIAKKENKPTIWIQASLSPNLEKRLKEFLQLGNIWNSEDLVQVWIKRKSGLVDIFQVFGTELHLVGKIIRRKFYKLKNFEF